VHARGVAVRDGAAGEQEAESRCGRGRGRLGWRKAACDCGATPECWMCSDAWCVVVVLKLPAASRCCRLRPSCHAVRCGCRLCGQRAPAQRSTQPQRAKAARPAAAGGGAAPGARGRHAATAPPARRSRRVRGSGSAPLPPQCAAPARHRPRPRWTSSSPCLTVWPLPWCCGDCTAHSFGVLRAGVSLLSRATADAAHLEKHLTLAKCRGFGS
jgi:hypothetical protein